MSKQQIETTVYQYSLILILLIAVAFRGGRDFLFQKNEKEVTVTLEDIRDIYPKADYYTQNRHGAFDIYASNGDKLGAALRSSDYSKQFGYGGRVPLLIGVDDSLTIAKIVLLPNHETGDYIEAIYGNKFIGKWQGVSLEDAMQLQVDIVSGATLTSNAVIAGVRHTASSVMKSDASVITETNLWTTIKDILFLSLMVLSLVMTYKKGTAKYRTIYLLFVLVIMGLILNSALSVQLLHGWLQSGFAWRANWQTGVIFILALALSFVGKRKFYCNYLCPMGALQELTNRFTPFKKRKLPTRFKGITAREVYLALIAGALLIGFTPELSYFEPFMFFSFRIVGIALIIFGIVVLVLSLFITKPWCSVCPTGCVIDNLSYQKAKNIKS
ncbi:MAG: 4Fe-4S binding protein [Salinivirgaceae bacterium]|jgi:NosR/NirI family nitrous oxide reductase transcriptional regulator|nr:4Fe-4S binding protein [Salinivirgaceae bacterium]